MKNESKAGFIALAAANIILLNINVYIFAINFNKEIAHGYAAKAAAWPWFFCLLATFAIELLKKKKSGPEWALFVYSAACLAVIIFSYALSIG